MYGGVLGTDPLGQFELGAVASTTPAIPGFTLDSVLRSSRAGSFTCAAAIFKRPTATFTLDAYIVIHHTGSFTADAIFSETPQDIVQDDFDRTVTNGWGTAPSGKGPWTLLNENDGTDPSFLSTDGANHEAVIVDTGNWILDSEIGTYLKGKKRLGEKIWGVVSLVSAANLSNPHTAFARIYLRHDGRTGPLNTSKADYYCFELRFKWDFTLAARIRQNVDGVGAVIVDWTDIGQSWSFGERFYFIAAAWKHDPTQLRFKIWKRGDPIPPFLFGNGSATSPKLTDSGGPQTAGWIGLSTVTQQVVKPVQWRFGAVKAFWIDDQIEIDAVIKGTQAHTLTANAVLKKVGQTGSFSMDAAFVATPIPHWFINAWTKATLGGTFSADAVLQRARSGSFTADAFLLAVRSFTSTLDAVLRDTSPGVFTLDAWLVQTTQASLSVRAVLFKSAQASFTCDAWIVLQGQRVASFTADAILFAQQSSSLAADAVLLRGRTAALTAQAVLLSPRSGSLTANAAIHTLAVSSFTADAVLSRTTQAAVPFDAVLFGTRVRSLSADAVIGRPAAGSFSLDAWIVIRTVGTFPLSAITHRLSTQSFVLEALTKELFQRDLTLDAVLAVHRSGSLDVDAVLRRSQSAVVRLDSITRRSMGGTYSVAATVRRVSTATFSLDAWIIPPVFHVPFSAVLQRGMGSHFTFDAVIGFSALPEFQADTTIEQIEYRDASEWIDYSDATAFMESSTELGIIEADTRIQRLEVR